MTTTLTTDHLLRVTRPSEGAGLMLHAYRAGEDWAYTALLLTEDGDLDLALEYLGLEASWASMVPLGDGPGFSLRAQELDA